MNPDPNELYIEALDGTFDRINQIFDLLTVANYPKLGDQFVLSKVLFLYGV